MKTDTYQPLLHRVAIVTAVVALLPIMVGALVTTNDAGMAFPDWPSSDGHFLLSYPWLKSVGDKFIEHGHRLAGVLIGLVSIALVATAWFKERRGWVKAAAVAVLLAVIAQGVLGGQRVILDARVLAMVHGSFAAIVFALMVSVALFTSRSWFSIDDAAVEQPPGLAVMLAFIAPLLVLVQFVLGGFVRHVGTALHEHLGAAFIVLATVLLVFAVAHFSRIRWIQRPARIMLALVLVQVLLGAAAWITKYGFAPLGYVAVQQSSMQVLVRTAHTVVGMLLFAATVTYSICVLRLCALARQHEPLSTLPTRLPGHLSMKGGPQ